MRRWVGNPDFGRRLGFGVAPGPPDFGAVGRRVGNPDFLRFVGPGSVVALGAEVEDIHCPTGFQPNGDSEGNVWCEDAKQNRVPATFTPAADQGTTTSSVGILGWGMIVAGALLVGAVVMKPKGRR